MLDSFFTGWGAFAMMLAMFVPFSLALVYVLSRKGVGEVGAVTPSLRTKLTKVEGVWISAVFVIFVGVNLISLEYMPTIKASRVASSGAAVQEINLTAQSWAYDLSSREVEAERPVRFSGRSTDTMHGFAIYHPDGRLLFTMMLMPGLKSPTSIVHTFKEPGKYKVRCLEYCGIAHHAMQDEITVVARRG